VAYLALELAEMGDLIKVITTHGKFSEEIARLYFGQLVDVLEYIHLKGYCHRDIKPDNILFDLDYNLKL
jgi:serine/threonine protein kinase